MISFPQKHEQAHRVASQGAVVEDAGRERLRVSNARSSVARADSSDAVDEEEVLAALDPEMAQAIRALRRAQGRRRTLGELIMEHEKRQAEDEALILTLEPKMAEAIRIQKRLFGWRKSVRELIDDYKPEPEPMPKTWWAKVKEGALHGRG